MQPIEASHWIDTEEEARERAANAFFASLDKMTPEERFQTLVRSGIYTQDGRLRKEYGGDA